MLFTFLLIVQALVAASLIAVILMQRSEGGGLGAGSSSAGLMTARGAADFLTRATAILATLFILLSIGLAALATMQAGPGKIDTSLAKKAPPASTAPAPDSVPLVGGGAVPADPLAAAATKSAAPSGNSSQGVPLAQ
jgi:preprotein translocase subunit SecG